MPAIGFAMNVDAITDILINNGKGKKAPNVDVLVHCDDGYEMKAFCYAANLVGEGECDVKTASLQPEKNLWIMPKKWEFKG